MRCDKTQVSSLLDQRSALRAQSSAIHCSGTTIGLSGSKPRLCSGQFLTALIDKRIGDPAALLQLFCPGNY